MNNQEFHDRVNAGLYFEEDVWWRRSVTDINGRCAPLVAEMRSGAKPAPWFHEQYRDDALAALSAAEPDTVIRDQLHAYISVAPVADRAPGAAYEIVHVGEGPSFRRARAVWVGPESNPYFWSRIIRNFWRRYQEGEPHVPFVNQAARDAWIHLSPQIQPEAMEEDATDLDMLAIMQAVRLHPCLP